MQNFILTPELDEKMNIFMEMEHKEFLNRKEIYKGQALKTFEESIPHYSDDQFTDHVRKQSYIISMQECLQLKISGGEKVRILDAGCGFGSQSLLFAILGGITTGIDILPEKVDLAAQRRDYYEKELQDKIHVQFLNKDIFKTMDQFGFDIIWLREAISHIHPIEKFFSVARECLPERGLIFISDANWSNPFVKIELFKDYWRNYSFFSKKGESSMSYIEYVKDPSSGEQVEFAMERVFTLNTLSKILEDAGFRIIKGRTFGFIPKSTISKLLLPTVDGRKKVFNYLCKLENKISNMPVLKRYGITNIVVAQK